MRDPVPYQERNGRVIDGWCRGGWEWGLPVDHRTLERARRGDWALKLTPVKTVPVDWIGDPRGKKVLGLAAGGGQQLAILSVLGASCTLLDISGVQCESERAVAEREGYAVEILRADMTRPLPFPDATFDLVLAPVSNCYVERMEPVFRECHRVLKEGGALVGGFDNGMNFVLDDKGTALGGRLPFNPLADSALYRELLRQGDAIQFSHTVTEIIGGQLAAGFRLVDLYEDTNGEGLLHDLDVPSFLATRAVKAG